MKRGNIDSDVGDYVKDCFVETLVRSLYNKRGSSGMGCKPNLLSKEEVLNLKRIESGYF